MADSGAPGRLRDPDRDIGGGRTLTSIQRADLFGDHDREGVARLVAAVLRVLGQGTGSASARPQTVTTEQEHSGTASNGTAPFPDRQAEELGDAENGRDRPGPANTDRWRLTYTTADVPAMTQLGNQGFDHRAYMRTAEQTPPWIRVRAVVACDLLGEAPGWRPCGAGSRAFFTQESVRGLIWQLADIQEGARWRPRATYRRSWLEAELTVAQRRL